MGGSGGRGYRTDSGTASARERVRRDLAAQVLRAGVNEMLDELLAGYNDRDTEAIQDKLAEVEQTLEDQGYSVSRLLFGGSVAKHTYVDGLSDVDSLIYLPGAYAGTPAEILAHLARDLRGRLQGASDVSAGTMAVTVTYQDGTSLQLLPAVERSGRTQVPDPAGGDGWKAIRPHKFTEKLTGTNQRQGGGVVPAIKLAKGLVDTFPKDQRLSGYHLEALAVDAFRRYTGPKDRAAMLEHLLGRAVDTVLRPTGDITGQTLHIDAHLGPAGSPPRRAISRQLSAALARLGAATSPEQYRQVIE